MCVATYQHTCTNCQKEYDRTTPWIDPVNYSEPELATKTDTFWCPKCKKGQAVTLQMLPAEQVAFVGHIEYGSLVKDDAGQVFRKQTPAQQKTEEESLEALGVFDN